VWTVFDIGLLVQAFSLGLRIEHNKFVDPGAISQSQIRRDEIVALERKVLVSATMTVTGARGLAVCDGRSRFRRPGS
jgi:hypothetical protein